MTETAERTIHDLASEIAAILEWDVEADHWDEEAGQKQLAAVLSKWRPIPLEQMAKPLSWHHEGLTLLEWLEAVVDGKYGDVAPVFAEWAASGVGSRA